jgi:PIN domain nuclease of toxin-antitoxin system
MTSKIIIPFISLLTFFVISCNNSGQQSDTKINSNNVFATVNYDRVVAYSYDGEGDIEIIDEKGKLADKIKKQVELSKAQTIKLTNILCNKSTYGGDIAACFDPHFGVVFYKTNKPVAYVSICLDCNYLVSSIKIADEGGFSNDGIKKIMNFEKELKFSQ